MLARSQTARPAHRPRRAFTLIEVMVVIVILTILVALLLPAINRVRVNARIAQVKTEISSLESAIATFKTMYSVDPPSQLVICETAANWTSTAAAVVDSRAKIRQIWPQFDFTISRDFDCDGTVSATN